MTTDTTAGHTGPTPKREFATQTEREVYEHYLSGSERGDLFTYAKMGAAGIKKGGMTPNQKAAWKGGADRAAIAKALPEGGEA